MKGAYFVSVMYILRFGARVQIRSQCVPGWGMASSQKGTDLFDLDAGEW